MKHISFKDAYKKTNTTLIKYMWTNIYKTRWKWIVIWEKLNDFDSRFRDMIPSVWLNFHYWQQTFSIKTIIWIITTQKIFIRIIKNYTSFLKSSSRTSFCQPKKAINVFLVRLCYTSKKIQEKYLLQLPTFTRSESKYLSTQQV